MKLTSLLYLAVIILAFFNHSFVRAEKHSDAICSNVESVKWLLGEWQSKTSESLITESWKMKGRTLIGKGITKKNKSKSPDFVEHLNIQKIGNEIFYSAKPPQNEFPTSFKLTDCSDSYIKFENSTHDFPQVISYTKISNNSLRADVSSKLSNGFSIHFDRVKPAVLAQPNGVSKSKVVLNYVESYNEKDLEGMMSATTENIHWMTVNGRAVSTETSNRDELIEALKLHFKGSGKYYSSLSGMTESGSFVFAVEKSTNLLSEKKSSSCSFSVYEFSQDEGQANLIKNVWYYAAQKCE